jgi:hypothetical protein
MRWAFEITTILALIFLVGLQVVEVAEANPFFIYNFIEPIPGTISSNITIINPQNNTVYSADIITASFNVSKPQLTTCESAITSINYTLDDEVVQVYTIHPYEDGFGTASGIPKFNTTFALPTLTTGNHNLTVTAEGVVWAYGCTGNPHDIFFIDSSSTIFFTMQLLEPTVTPSQTPTIPESTGAMPTINDGPIVLNQSLKFLPFGVISALVILIAVEVLVIVFFRRRK